MLPSARAGPTPAYPQVPAYSDNDDEMEAGRMASSGSSSGGGARVQDYRSVAASHEATPFLNAPNTPPHTSYTADGVIENPNFRTSPGGPDAIERNRRFYNVVRDILDDLPSTRREVHNMVEAATRYRQRVAADNVMQLMDSVGGGRAPSPSAELRNRFHFPVQGSRSLGASDAVDVDPVLGMRPTHSLGVPQQSTGGTPLPFVNEELQQIDDMRNAIREQNSNIEVKRARARKLNNELADRKRRIGRFQLWWSLTVQSIYSWISKTSHALERSSLWANQIKSLQGKHGHHVGIYFKFLRWCLVLNAWLMTLIAVFVIIPYALRYGFDDADTVIYGERGGNVTVFNTFVGLFNGGGALNASAYFMGTYYIPDAVPFGVDNTTGSVWDPDGAGADGVEGQGYDLALAYLLVIGAVMLFSFFLIFWGVYDAIRASVLQVGVKLDEQMATVALCRLDYSIDNPRSLKLHRRDLKNELKTLLDEGAAKEAYVTRMASHWRWIWFKRTLINVSMLLVLIACFSAIFTAVDETDDTDGGSLVPAFVLAAVNAVVPFLFEKLAFLEEWRTELTVIKLTIIRSVVLRFIGLYVFMYASYRRHEKFECWESYLGQESYTVFVIGSILFEIATGLIFDMLVTVSYNRVPLARELLGEPAYFDTIKKTLELTYAQALIWIGCYFSPLLPLVGILRVCVLFYVQKWSTMTWCEPKQKRFLSTHSLPKLIWSLFLASFVLVAIPLGYVIPRASSSGIHMPAEWQDRFVDTLLSNSTPCPVGAVARANCKLCFDASVSAGDFVCWNPLPGGGRHPDGAYVTAGVLCAACPRGCGPFRNERAAYSSLDREYNSWPEDVQGVIAFLGTTAFTVILAFALLGCCLATHAKTSALQSHARKLQVERDMERLDKRWILERYAITFDQARQFGESPGYLEPAPDGAGAGDGVNGGGVGALGAGAAVSEASEDVVIGGSRIIHQEAV